MLQHTIDHLLLCGERKFTKPFTIRLNSAGLQLRIKVPDPVTTKLHISGQFPTRHFVGWIIDRAERLSLAGWVRMHSDKHIELLVCGERILVEALEVSCSLGPIDAQVDSIKTQNFRPSASCSRQTGKFVEYSGLECF